MEKGKGKRAILEKLSRVKKRLWQIIFSNKPFTKFFTNWVNYKESHIDLKKEKLLEEEIRKFLRGLIFI